MVKVSQSLYESNLDWSIVKDNNFFVGLMYLGGGM